MAAIVAMAPCAFADAATAAAAGVDLDVAYCESTGEQYIDTGILGNPGLRVEADIVWMTTSSEDQHILGSYDKIGDNARRCYPLSTIGDLTTMFHFGDKLDYGWFQYRAGGRYKVEVSFGASAQSLVIKDADGGLIYSNSDSKTYTSVASGQTLYLFASGNSLEATGYAHMTKARVYRMKIYLNDTLVRDYLPAKRGDEYGLWEDVGGAFCGSATEAPFKGDVPRAVTVDGKPDFFAQWIQSNGSTFIDTGVIARPETKIEAKYQLKDVAFSRLVGARVGNSLYFAITCHNGARMQFVSAGSAVYLDGGTYVANTDYTAVMDVHTNSQTYTVIGPSATLTTNDTLTASSLSPFTLYVFGMNYNGSVDGQSKARLYYMKIWQDGNLVRDFVPGIKNGEGCLYDRIHDKCYFSGATNGVITSAKGLIGPPVGTPRYPKYRLSYLGAEGNSYFDTGVLGNPGLKVVGEIAFMGAVPGNANNIDWHILGSFDNSSYGSGVSRRCYVVSAVSSGRSYFGGGAAATQLNFFYTLGQKYKIESNFGETSQTLKVNDVNSFTVNGDFAQVDSGKTLYLFALGHSSNGVSSQTRGRIYWLKIYQNGALVRDYMPVIADNGGPYLYDKATRTFCQGVTSSFWDVGEIGERVPLGFGISIR